MPTNIIKDPPRKWKKNEWKSFHPHWVKAVLWRRERQIRKLELVAHQEGIAAIIPSDDDDLDFKERPDA